VIGNFVIFHKIKVAKHIWDPCCHLWQKLAADLPSLGLNKADTFKSNSKLIIIKNKSIYTQIVA